MTTTGRFRGHGKTLLVIPRTDMPKKVDGTERPELSAIEESASGEKGQAIILHRPQRREQ